MEDDTKPPATEYVICTPGLTEFQSKEVCAAAQRFLQDRFPGIKFEVRQAYQDMNSDEWLIMPVLAGVYSNDGSVQFHASRDRLTEHKIELALEDFKPEAARRMN